MSKPSEMDVLFPLPTGVRNADDMGMPPAPAPSASDVDGDEEQLVTNQGVEECDGCGGHSRGAVTFLSDLPAVGNKREVMRQLADFIHRWPGGAPNELWSLVEMIGNDYTIGAAALSQLKSERDAALNICSVSGCGMPALDQPASVGSSVCAKHDPGR